jgi:hypothetical protein
MTDESNPHSNVSTEERKAAEIAEQAAAKETPVEETPIQAVSNTEVKANPVDPEADAALVEDDKEEGKPDDGEAPLDTQAWGDTNSEVGNSVLRLIQNAGGTPEQAKALLFDAVRDNDMSKIDKAELTNLVGESNATIIMSGAASYATEIAAKNVEIAKTVNEAVGGSENWEAIQNWSDNSDLPDAEKAEYNELLSAGGAKARFAATELLNKYNADSGNTQITDTNRVDPDVDTTTQSEAITAREYYKRMAMANRKGQDTTAIKAARAKGRKLGI